jgi:TolB-like protein
MMRKRIIAPGLLFAAIAAFGQTKPSLGILPFTGGSGRDGDTIANLFANSNILGREFMVVPRTSNVESIMREQEFQRVGLTDSDTIAELGKQMGAAYVVSGHIARFRDRNLLLISIISVEKMEQIAGDYREYNAIEEVRRLLPSMAENIVTSVRQKIFVLKPGSSDALAVLPLNIQDEDVEQNDAELLAQILLTEIANTHRYEVLPRTKTIETVMREQELQRSGLTDRETMAAIGEATNAQYVLAGTITRLGSMNLFDVKVLHIRSGQQISGKDYEYQNLVDGIEIMKILARDVTGISEEEERARRDAEEKGRFVEEQRAEERRIVEEQEAERLRIAGVKARRAKSRLYSFGFAAGSTFTVPWVVVNLNDTFSLVPYTVFDIGVDAGFIHRYEEPKDLKYFSLYPYGHLNLYVPMGNGGGMFIGAGAGYMMAFYKTGDEQEVIKIPAAEATAGFYFGRKNYYFRIAYAPRTLIEDFFSVINHKVTIGYSYRWE